MDNEVKGHGVRDSDREIEKTDKKDDTGNDSAAAITTTAVGVALIVAAVLVIITAGTPAAGIGFILGAAACLGWSVPKLMQKNKSLPAPESHEKELLSAIRNSGGDITPAEAAMETSLTVREADRLLTELANEGHLKVDSRDGVLSYGLPNRKNRELG